MNGLHSVPNGVSSVTTLKRQVNQSFTLRLSSLFTTNVLHISIAAPLHHVALCLTLTCEQIPDACNFLPAAPQAASQSEGVPQFSPPLSEYDSSTWVHTIPTSAAKSRDAILRWPKWTFSNPQPCLKILSIKNQKQNWCQGTILVILQDPSRSEELV